MQNGFHSAALWVRAYVVVTLLGFSVLAGFGCRRVSFYFMRDPAGYFSPFYTAPPNTINDVIPHVACGFTTFLLVPVLVLTYCMEQLRSLRLPVALAFLAMGLATAGTIVPIPTHLGELAGTGVVAAAGIWAAWWGATGAVAAVFACKKNQERFEEWFLRCVAARGAPSPARQVSDGDNV